MKYGETSQKIYELRNRYRDYLDPTISRLMITKPEGDHIIYRSILPLIKKFRADDPLMVNEVERLLKKDIRNWVIMYQLPETFKIEIYCGRPSKFSAKNTKSSCFISAALNDSLPANEIVLIPQFRDHVLTKSMLGTLFVHCYYLFSPFLAQLIAQSGVLKEIVKIAIISPLVKFVGILLYRDGNR
ncbi:MAG: CFI-box-CTERM domain-containing protein [candidate division WOR-3 bacterium]